MIGKRIQEYRMSLRLKVGEFARTIGISQGSLSDIENIKTKPSADTLEAIIRNTDINPGWLFTGDGPMRKGDFLTGSGGPFLGYQEETDHELMWKVIEQIHFAMRDLGLDPKELSEDKRDTIRDLIYSDTLRKKRQPDEKYAKILCSLTYCETCGEGQRRKKILGEIKQSEKIFLLVKTKPGEKCPMEGKPREYIKDAPIEVPDTPYYIRLIDDGSLILLETIITDGRPTQEPLKRGNSITQTVSGNGHRVAGRDFNEGSGRSKK
ncbi:MAG TPA: helix-turn-helix transcriptional regulator [Desulfuromonadaceae bacterium]